MIGLCGAALWLMVVSLGFFLLSLWMVDTSKARNLFFVVAVAAVAPIAINILIIRSVLQLPNNTSGEQMAVRRSMHRRFLIVVGGEVAAFIIVNPVCAVMRHYEIIVPLDVLIVGIHFLPLAWIFQVPRYYLMGVLFCLVAALTLFVVPESMHFGRVRAWYVFPGLGSAPVAWVTAWANLWEAWKFVRISRTNSR
jgi:hypothetical protein